ncbi:hypothetical protein [Flavobacterium sp. HSC-61S13]|uniref:hypothetical protein n=1 Tax=Flavobacterium sp. HSC-61S13 TaxID=2910963 RepID=UPI00209EE7A5|nr:hypothetical protein [Flavobacterium sp. HSC-61S13]MCP1996668.1 hypothetical protein [Flavobacterium sp. HSC-61S13]
MRLTNILDADQNAIINFVCDKRSQNPASPVEGQVYYNTLSKFIMRYDGTEWKAIGGILEIYNSDGGIKIETVDGIATIDLNIDNTTIEIKDGLLIIKDQGVSTSKIKDAAVTTVKVTDKAITFAKINDIPTMTVIGRVVAGTGSSSAIPIINTNDLSGANGQSLVTSGAVKAYIDSTYAGLGRPQGSWDANANNVFPGNASTKNGDYWRVSVAGTIQGNPFQVGDLIQAFKNNPINTNPNDYILLQTNTDQATTTVLGLLMIATAAEVQLGQDNKKAITSEGLSSRTATETRTGLASISTAIQALDANDDTTIMTPKKVKLVMDASATNKGYVQVFGGVSSIEYFIKHDLNTKDLIADFFELPQEKKCLVDYSIIDVNTIGVYFGKAPGLNKMKIVIIPKG